MAYVGGKAKGCEHIMEVLNDRKYDNKPYLEPFVGYGHILRRVKNKSSYRVSDANELVVSLLSGIQEKKGKYPTITRAEYYKLKAKEGDVTFRRAIAAFCYSYNGKEWGGYTERSVCGKRESYPDERKRYYDMLRLNDVFMRTKIERKDYKGINPKGCIIYCDPPYANTTGYSSEFDTSEFWEVMRKWSSTNDVFISEYNAPADFKCIAKRKKHQSLNGKGSGVVKNEKLYKYRGKR
jgi:DNA adenine methylase